MCIVKSTCICVYLVGVTLRCALGNIFSGAKKCRPRQTNRSSRPFRRAKYKHGLQLQCKFVDDDILHHQLNGRSAQIKCITSLLFYLSPFNARTDCGSLMWERSMCVCLLVCCCAAVFRRDRRMERLEPPWRMFMGYGAVCSWPPNTVRKNARMLCIQMEHFLLLHLSHKWIC